MTDQTMGPRRKGKAPGRIPTARPARDTLIIDHESFQAMCRSVLNFSEELANIRRDISEIKLQNFQIGSNQEVTAGDLQEIVRRLAVLEQLAQPVQRYQPPQQQFDQHGRQPQLAPRQPGQQPPPLRDMLRNMQGIPQSEQQGFIPNNDPDNGRR